MHGPVVYKRSRRGDTEIDRAAAHVLAAAGWRDEVDRLLALRQRRAPVLLARASTCRSGAITRSGHDRSERHHTSADDLASIDPAALADTLGAVPRPSSLSLEDDATLVSRNPKGEPQLGRRGLYRSFGGRRRAGALESALLWVMSLADGEHTIARRGRAGRAAVRGGAEAATALERATCCGARHRADRREVSGR